MIEFLRMNPDGKMVKTGSVSQSKIMECRFCILSPEHYREDGSCKCDDAEHRKVMIEEWEYSEKDFEGIALRVK